MTAKPEAGTFAYLEIHSPDTGYPATLFTSENVLPDQMRPVLERYLLGIYRFLKETIPSEIIRFLTWTNCENIASLLVSSSTLYADRPNFLEWPRRDKDDPNDSRNRGERQGWPKFKVCSKPVDASLSLWYKIFLHENEVLVEVWERW